MSSHQKKYLTTNFSKDRILKLEYAKLNTQYAFTISVAEQSYGCLPEQRIKRVFRRTQQNLLNFASTIRYQLYPEISTGKANIHFHGYIEILDLYRFYMSFIPKMIDIASISVKEIDDENKWKEYIEKQQKIIAPICEDIGVKIPLTTAVDPDCTKQYNTSLNILGFF